MDEIEVKKIKVVSQCFIHRIGKMVKEKRVERGISQTDLAFFSYTDRSIINKIENGDYVNITIYTIYKIAAAFEEDVSVFLNV